MGLPPELIENSACQMAVLIMISSHRVVRHKQLDPALMEVIQPHYSQIWPVYYKIFNESSTHQRMRFFKEILVRTLWSRFRESMACEIHQYLQHTETSKSMSPQIFRAFLKDIRMTEMIVNFRIV